ncbi:GATA-type zinc finger protein 1 isoform X2 [Erythrolamprus reginae]|uniref:GATA-type zinc finger protein 1 isoform X2 n=1 Tax=Erythrolamprus reginae TaxID=121349 RepID=UPI00396CB4BF
MERDIFLEGQTPDFSVLQELLCPPCLEVESSYNPVSVVGDFESETSAARGFRFEPFNNMDCCVQMPDSKALDFLRESTQLLPQAQLISSNPEKPPWQLGQAVRSIHSICGPQCNCSHGVCGPQCNCFPSPLVPFAPADALTLISLHCSSLNLEPLDQVKPPEAGKVARERSPIAHSKDHSSHQLWRACVEEPRLTQVSESKRGKRKVFRKQPKPRRSYDALDPNFQGVTLHMKVCLCQSCPEGCRLIINTQFSRYKKYKIRCFHCWSIPKHGGKPYPHCSNCGGKLGVATAQHKSGKRCGNFVKIYN